MAQQRDWATLDTERSLPFGGVAVASKAKHSAERIRLTPANSVPCEATTPDKRKRRNRLSAKTPGRMKMTIEQICKQCLENKELVENFDRLRGTNLSGKGSPIERQIDVASGRQESDLKLFAEFIFDCVLKRFPVQ